MGTYRVISGILNVANLDSLPRDIRRLNAAHPSEVDYMRYTLVPRTFFANFPSLANLTLQFPFCEFHELGFIAGALQACPQLVRFSFQRPRIDYSTGNFDAGLSYILGVQPVTWMEQWPRAAGGSENWKIYAWFAGPGGWGLGQQGMNSLRSLEYENQWMV